MDQGRSPGPRGGHYRSCKLKTHTEGNTASSSKYLTFSAHPQTQRDGEGSVVKAEGSLGCWGALWSKEGGDSPFRGHVGHQVKLCVLGAWHTRTDAVRASLPGRPGPPALRLPMCKLSWRLRRWRICLQCRRPGFDPWVRRIPWRREWLPTPVFLPGESHGQRSLAGCSPWGPKESDMTEQLTLVFIYKLSSLFLDQAFRFINLFLNQNHVLLRF